MQVFLLGLGTWFIESNIPFWLFSVPLAVGAYYDKYCEKMVPDLIPAIMWILCSFMIVYNPFAYFALPLAFSGLLFLGALFAWFNKEFLGWSDLLALPPLICMLAALFLVSKNPLVLILLPIAYLVACWRSGMVREVPFYPYMLVAYCLSMLFMA